MNISPDFPQRKRNRLTNYDYSSCGAYFITICTKDRESLFWDKKQPDFVGEDIILPPDSVNLSRYGQIVKESVENISKRYPSIQVLQYVIMPNHIHLILLIPYDNGRILSSPTNIQTAIGQMKRHTSRRIGTSIWQKSFHDHIIRDKNDFDKISKYMYENPLRWQFDCFFTSDNID